MHATTMQPAPTVHGGPRGRTREAEPAAPGGRLRAFASAELRAAAVELARSGEARHQGVHQARKRLRRARAALALGRPRLGDTGRRLDADIGRLCRGMAPLRDAQALIEGLERLGHQASPELGAELSEAIGLARQRRDRLMASALSRDPQFQRRRDRIAELAQRLQRLPWADVDEDTVTAALARGERRLSKARRFAERHPGDDEAWHLLRRRLRRLRQQDNLLAQEQPGLRPVRTVPADEAARLGEAQDDALLLRHCGRRTPFPSGLRRSLRRVARERLERARSPVS